MVFNSALPIEAHEDGIIRAITENQVLILVGETGSGKTTKLPIYLYEAGFAGRGVIGITQPRQIAAISVAEFVSRQLDGKVGYKVRHDYHVTPDTQVKFMTDGILLSEIQKDRDLRQYSVIVVDEAHERSRNIDFVLGLLKDTLKRRPDLKVVVTSATIDQEKFSMYFGGAPVINVSGRTFPVEDFWLDQGLLEGERMPAIIDKIVEIHNGPEGDILVFMTGEDDIHAVAKKLEKLSLDNMAILPIYAALPPEKQREVFAEYAGKRKVVIATNIAETSITIDGIVYVIDTGRVKQLNFHPETNIQSLDVVEHSKAGCRQRAGRAGRTKPGICYHLYTRDNFDLREDFTEPEILRTNLSSIVLAMEVIGIEDVIGFDFIDQPSPEAFESAYKELIILGAIKKDGRGLTETGKKMASLPLEPRISKMILEAERLGCVEPVVTIAAMISTRNVFYRPKDEEEQRLADMMHSRFKNSASDVLSLLQVWREYEQSGKSGRWCHDNFLRFKALIEADKIRTQILQILDRLGMDTKEKDCKDEVVVRAVVSGLIYSLCCQSEEWKGYEGLLNGNLYGVFIFPGSSLSFAEPKCFVAVNVRKTTRKFAHFITEVKPEWLLDLVPDICSLGEKTLLDFDSEMGIGIAQRMVSVAGREIGNVTSYVGMQEAIKIQNESIRKAEENGWVRLTFRITAGRIFVEQAGRRYRMDWLASPDIKDGDVYYCSLERSPYEETIKNRVKVFDIRPPRRNKVDLSGLTARFNARR